MILIFKCANGIVAWIARQEGPRVGVIRCLRDNTVYPMTYVADVTWEETLTRVLTHSIQLAGAFQNLWVLPSHFDG